MRPVADQPTVAPTAEAAPEAGERPSGHRALVVEGLVVYVVLQLLTIPFLPALRRSRETFYDDVLLGFFMPEKHGLAKLLRAGFLPTWLDNQYGGEPFIANIQHGCCTRATCRSGCCPPPRRSRWSPPCTWRWPGSACGPTAGWRCGPGAGRPSWARSPSASAR